MTFSAIKVVRPAWRGSAEKVLRSSPTVCDFLRRRLREKEKEDEAALNRALFTFSGLARLNVKRRRRRQLFQPKKRSPAALLSTSPVSLFHLIAWFDLCNSVRAHPMLELMHFYLFIVQYKLADDLLHKNLADKIYSDPRDKNNKRGNAAPTGCAAARVNLSARKAPGWKLDPESIYAGNFEINKNFKASLFFYIY